MKAHSHPFRVDPEATRVKDSSGPQLHELKLVGLHQLGRVRVRHRVRTSEAVQFILVRHGLLKFGENQQVCNFLGHS